MPISEGLRTSLNQIRETLVQNNSVYAKQIDEISPNSDISVLSAPLFDDEDLMNDFLKVLAKRIIYTQVVNFKLFNNPLKVLEGSQMPLGSIGQEIHINPAKGRKFNVNDFAGLLAKYEADVKVQYMHLNSDIQYPLTITRAKLKDAFTSWANLEEFINRLTNSLYNGAYIDRYNFTKGLMASAYRDNTVQMQVVENPLSSEQLAKAFVTKARELFLNFKEPTSDYNAWKKVGGYGYDVLTWTDPEDIVFILRNDIASFVDVNVLAQAFNIDKSKLLGNIITIKDFTERDTRNNVVVDGSNIYAMMCDKKWFRIKNQETTMDEFYNANNRTWQLYLNDVNMFQYSLFCNAMMFVTKEPEVTITGIDVSQKEVTVNKGDNIVVTVSTTPAQANTPEITATSNAPGTATATIDGRAITITGVAQGSTTVTVKAGNVQTNITVNVTDTAAVSTMKVKQTSVTK